MFVFVLCSHFVCVIVCVFIFVHAAFVRIKLMMMMTMMMMMMTIERRAVRSSVPVHVAVPGHQRVVG